MLQFLPRRQISHVEYSTTEKVKTPMRESSVGYLERKTRHGSVISIENDETPLKEIDSHKNQLIKTLKKEVKKIMEESSGKKRLCIHSFPVTALCG